MSAPRVTEQPFTSETRDGVLTVKVGDQTAAIATPINSIAPGFRNAWNVTLFDPHGPGDAAAIAVDREAVDELTALFARMFSWAVSR